VGGWYTVFKRIKGKLYAYTQRSWREGKQVRVASRYMGGGSAYAALAAAAQGEKLTLHDAPALRLKPLSQAAALELWYESKLVGFQTSALPEQAIRALGDYSGRGYKRLNAALRGDIPMTSEIKQQALWVAKALRDPRAVLLHNVTLYRAAVLRFDKISLGETFEETAFMSCSVSQEVAAGWSKAMQTAPPFYDKAILKVIARKGERGFVSMRDLSTGDEDEILCIGSKMRILEIEKDKKGWTVTVERLTLEP
jgi:hypothetical protein